MLRRLVLGILLGGTLLSAGCAHCGHPWFRRRCPEPCPAPCPPNGVANPAFVPAAPPPAGVVVPAPPPPGAVSQFGPTPDVAPHRPLYMNGTYR